MATILGFNFPFRKGATAFPQRATDSEVIKQSLITLYGTVCGERQMHSDYGLDIIHDVFEANTPALADAIRYKVLYATAKFETRVKVQTVDVTRDEEDGSITLTVFYFEKATGLPQEVSVTLEVPLGG